jgi:NADH-quinone oxidoreductase subunit L
MPITFITLGIASLAISGFPGFSGFFSKDAILSAAYAHSPWMFWVGAITAGLTAFYVFRAFFMTFFGKYRGHQHPHESPLVMTVPLSVLALLSLVGGFLSVPTWLSPTYSVAEERMFPMLVSALCGILGIAVAAWMYVARPALAESMKATAGPIYTLLENKYYVDEIYSETIVKPVLGVSRSLLWRGVDQGLIDAGLVTGLARVVRGWGSLFRQWQSGSIRNYATWILAGSLLVIFVLGLFGGAR